jgi:hypothetical protein
MQWMRLICCGMAAKRLAMLGASAYKMEMLTAPIETVTLIDEGII